MSQGNEYDHWCTSPRRRCSSTCSFGNDFKQEALYFDYIVSSVSSSRETELQFDEELSEYPIEFGDELIDDTIPAIGRPVLGRCPVFRWYRDIAGSEIYLNDQLTTVLEATDLPSLKGMLGDAPTDIKDFREHIFSFMLQIGNQYVRQASKELTSLGFDVTPLYLTEAQFAAEFSEGTSEYLSLLIKHWPVIAEDVPFADLIAYRRDPETKAKLLALKIAIRGLARGEKMIAEISEEIIHNLNEYEKHMNLLTRRRNHLLTELIVNVASVSSIKGMFDKPLRTAIKQYVDYRGRKLDLDERELAIPGRHMAFIYDAKERLG